MVTIGYPRVAMTNDSYQLSHKGEINALVKDYTNREYYIFSAKTGPGNSGGPLINKLGLVVGIISQDFFENNTETNIPVSYSAAIPSFKIKSFIIAEMIKEPNKFRVVRK